MTSYPRPFAGFFPTLPPAERCLADAQLSVVASELTTGDWALVDAEARWAAEEALCPDPLLDESGPRERNGARPQACAVRGPAGCRAPRSASDDPLLELEAADFVEALAGVEVPRGGVIRCPLPDHDDRSPSFTCYAGPGGGFYCFGCHRSGSVYDFAAALWGYAAPLRGTSFVEVRRRLLDFFARSAAA